MDAEPERPRRKFRSWLLIPCALLICGAVGWRAREKKLQIESVKNYAIGGCPVPVGWKTLPHGPQTLFKYEDPKTNLVIRGATNQMVSDVNPTPELDTDGIAHYYIDRTEESMPNWTATVVGTVPGKDTPFQLIRRGTKDRVIVTAYAVRGNTTVLISLIGMAKAKDVVDSNMAMFDTFLGKVSLTEKDMSNL